ncbi:MAG: O-antigen ligase family protein [Lachnospiraceae bacterium]
MIELQQKIYIRLLNPLIRKVSVNMGEKRRKRTMIGGFLGLILCIVFTTNIIPINAILRICLCTLFLGISLLGATKIPLELVNWNKKLLYPTYCFSLCFLIAGISTKSISYIAYAIIFGIVILGFIFVWNNVKEYGMLFHSFSCALEISFYIVLLISVIFCPLGHGQYNSLFGNPNSLGCYISTLVSTQIYLIEKDCDNHRKRHLIILVIAIAFGLLSASRTTLICMGISLILCGVYNYKKGKSCKEIVRKFLQLLLIIVLGYCIVSTCLKYGTNGIMHVEKKLFNKAYTLDSYVYAARYQNQGTAQILKDRIEKGITNTDEIGSGRMDIWKKYLEKISFSAHKQENIAIGMIHGNPQYYYAHNVFLQLAYSAGALSGISFLLLIIMVFYYLYRHRNKEFTEELLFIYSGIGISVLTMLLSDGYLPYAYPTVLIFWIAASPLYHNMEER